MKKISNYILLVPILLFVFMNVFPFIDPGQRGYYNTEFGYIVCHDHSQCLEEIGHKLDQSMGWVSQSDAYRLEVKRFIESNASVPVTARHPFYEAMRAFPGILSPLKKNCDPTSYCFWTAGWGGTLELYPHMFMMSDGKPENMPSGFLKFYNWDEAKRLLEKYQRFK